MIARLHTPNAGRRLTHQSAPFSLALPFTEFEPAGRASLRLRGRSVKLHPLGQSVDPETVPFAEQIQQIGRLAALLFDRWLQFSRAIHDGAIS